MDDLTERERAMLDLEQEAHLLPRSKEQEIRLRFGGSPSTYYKAVAALIERPAAYEYDPLTVMRLRRQRSDRRRQRVESGWAGRSR